MAENTNTPPTPTPERLAELRTTFIRLNAAIRERLQELRRAEQHIVDQVLGGHMSMDPQKVDGYKLADGMLARSMRLNVRINQRSLLYFNIRRRQLRRTLASLGIDADALEQEWLAAETTTHEHSHQHSAPVADSMSESQTEPESKTTQDPAPSAA